MYKKEQIIKNNIINSLLFDNNKNNKQIVKNSIHNSINIKLTDFINEDNVRKILTNLITSNRYNHSEQSYVTIIRIKEQLENYISIDVDINDLTNADNIYFSFCPYMSLQLNIIDISILLMGVNISFIPTHSKKALLYQGIVDDLTDDKINFIDKQRNVPGFLLFANNKIIYIQLKKDLRDLKVNKANINNNRDLSLSYLDFKFLYDKMNLNNIIEKILNEKYYGEPTLNDYNNALYIIKSIEDKFIKIGKNIINNMEPYKLSFPETKSNGFALSKEELYQDTIKNMSEEKISNILNSNNKKYKKIAEYIQYNFANLYNFLNINNNIILYEY